MKLSELLEQIKSISEEHQYKGIKIADLPIYLAISDNNKLALIVQSQSRSIPQYISSNLVSLRLNEKFTINVNGDICKNQSFHILQCESINSLLVETFILLSQAFANQIKGIQSAENELVIFFDSLIQLFKLTPSNNLQKERQGLWGELFIIKHYGVRNRLISMWHTEPTNKFDFSLGKLRFEIKTTTGLERVHTFSHDQLYCNNSKRVVIGSLILREDNAGLSLRELINYTRISIGSNLQLLLKLEKAIKRAGMLDDVDKGPIYDEEEALSNLAWYRAEDVPKFPLQEPPGVSNTHYRVNLTGCPKMENKEIEYLLKEHPSSN